MDVQLPAVRIQQRAKPRCQKHGPPDAIEDAQHWKQKEGSVGVGPDNGERQRAPPTQAPAFEIERYLFLSINKLIYH